MINNERKIQKEKLEKLRNDLMDFLFEEKISDEGFQEVTKALTLVDRELFYRYHGYEDGREVKTEEEMEAETWKYNQFLGASIPYLKEEE